MAGKDYTPTIGEMSTPSSKGTKKKYKPKRPRGFGHVVTYKNKRSPHVAFFKDASGDQISKSFTDHDEAEKFLDDLYFNRERLKEYTQTGATVAGYSEVFIAKQRDKVRKGKMKKSSLSTKEDNINRVVELLGGYSLSQIDSSVVEHRLIDVLWEAGLSESIMHKCKQIVVEMLRSAAADKYISKTPVIDFVMPTAKSPVEDDDDTSAGVNYMTDDEIKLYTEECRRTYTPGRGAKYKGETIPVHQTGYRLMLLLHTGLRLSEAIALEWGDFNDASKTLKIDKNLVRTGEGKVLQTPKTEAGKRMLVLNKDAYRDILELKQIYDRQSQIIDEREQRAVAKAESELSGKALVAEKRRISTEYKKYRAGHKYICGSNKFPFGPADHSSTLKTHNLICEDIGLDHKVTVHGLRHTFVTHYYLAHHNDDDFDLVLFSRYIGHASIRTTLEVYAHLNMVASANTARDLDSLKDF